MVHQSLVAKPSLCTAAGSFEMKNQWGMKIKSALCCCIANLKLPSLGHPDVIVDQGWGAWTSPA